MSYNSTRPVLMTFVLGLSLLFTLLLLGNNMGRQSAFAASAPDAGVAQRLPLSQIGCLNFSGLEHCATGQAQMAVLSQTLQITNITGSSQDGVYITLVNGDGWQVRWRAPAGLPDGARVRTQAIGGFNSQPNQPLAYTQAEKLGTQIRLQTDFPSMDLLHLRLHFYANGDLITVTQQAPGQPLLLNGSFPTGVQYLVLSADAFCISAGDPCLVATYQFPADDATTFLLGGQQKPVDELRVYPVAAHPELAHLGRLTSIQIRPANLPLLVIDQEQIARFNQWHTGLLAAQLGATTDVGLTVQQPADCIGAKCFAGLLLDLQNALEFSATLSFPSDVSGTLEINTRAPLTELLDSDCSDTCIGAMIDVDAQDVDLLAAFDVCLQCQMSLILFQNGEPVATFTAAPPEDPLVVRRLDRKPPTRLRLIAPEAMQPGLPLLLGQNDWPGATLLPTSFDPARISDIFLFEWGQENDGIYRAIKEGVMSGPVVGDALMMIVPRDPMANPVTRAAAYGPLILHSSDLPAFTLHGEQVLQRLMHKGLPHYSLGNAKLTQSPDLLLVSNLQGNSVNGVAIALPGLLGEFYAPFQLHEADLPLTSADLLPYIRIEAAGVVNGGVVQSLGYNQIAPASAQNNLLQIVADFSAIHLSAIHLSGQRLEVWQSGQLVRRVSNYTPGPAGLAATVNSWPAGAGVMAGSGLGYFWRWATAGSITLINGETVVGDELRILVETSALEKSEAFASAVGLQSAVDTFAITARGFALLRIGAETMAPEYHSYFPLIARK